MKGWAQILSAALAALVSGFLILGSLAITVVENAGDRSLGASAVAGRTAGTAELPADDEFTEAPAGLPSSTAPALQIPSALPETPLPPATSTQTVSPGAGASVPAAAVQVVASRAENPGKTPHAGDNAVPGYPVLTELGLAPPAAP